MMKLFPHQQEALEQTKDLNRVGDMKQYPVCDMKLKSSYDASNAVIPKKWLQKSFGCRYFKHYD